MERVDPALKRQRNHGLPAIARAIPSVRRVTPGLIAAFAIAVVARLVGNMIGFVPEAVVGLVFGVAIANLLRPPMGLSYGVRFALRYLLRAAIVILGVGLDFGVIARTGTEMITIIVVCFVISFSFFLIIAKLSLLPSRIATLLGAGSAICGATAILTIGPLISATEIEMAYAVATIFSYNALAVISYPVLGHILNLGASDFGIWAGTSINDTAAVVATGYIFSDAAGLVATLVKMTRTVLLVLLAVAVGVRYRSEQGSRTGLGDRVFATIPWFVLAFIGTGILGSIGILPEGVIPTATDVAKFLIVMVMVSVGLSAELAQMRKIGLRAFLLGLGIGVVMGGISLGLVEILS